MMLLCCATSMMLIGWSTVQCISHGKSSSNDITAICLDVLIIMEENLLTAGWMIELCQQIFMIHYGLMCLLYYGPSSATNTAAKSVNMNHNGCSKYKSVRMLGPVIIHLGLSIPGLSCLGNWGQHWVSLEHLGLRLPYLVGNVQYTMYIHLVVQSTNNQLTHVNIVSCLPVVPHSYSYSPFAQHLQINGYGHFLCKQT